MPVLPPQNTSNSQPVNITLNIGLSASTPFVPAVIKRAQAEKAFPMRLDLPCNVGWDAVDAATELCNRERKKDTLPAILTHLPDQLIGSLGLGPQQAPKRTPFQTSGGHIIYTFILT